MDSRIAAGGRPPMPVPSRQSSLKRPMPRVASAGGRSLLSKAPLTPPSFLNGSGESIAVQNSGHLSLPSPPQSRNSSAQGSYATSATTIEDVDHDARAARRRANSNATLKDGKGNVLVSVRIRPDAVKDGSSHSEWDIDNKRALVAYRGREGGEYIYGNVARQLHVSGPGADLLIL